MERKGGIDGRSHRHEWRWRQRQTQWRHGHSSTFQFVSLSHFVALSCDRDLEAIGRVVPLMIDFFFSFLFPLLPLLRVPCPPTRRRWRWWQQQRQRRRLLSCRDDVIHLRRVSRCCRASSLLLPPPFSLPRVCVSASTLLSSWTGFC